MGAVAPHQRAGFQRDVRGAQGGKRQAGVESETRTDARSEGMARARVERRVARDRVEEHVEGSVGRSHLTRIAAEVEPSEGTLLDRAHRCKCAVRWAVLEARTAKRPVRLLCIDGMSRVLFKQKEIPSTPSTLHLRE